MPAFKHLHLLARLMVLLPAFASADVFHVYSGKLPRAERRALEQAACLKPHGVKMEESSGNYVKDGLWGKARCKPHDYVDKLPIQYEVTCALEGEAWNCFNEFQYLRAKVGGRELRLAAPREIMSDAYGVARYLVQSGRLDSSLYHNRGDLVSIKPRHFIHVQVEPAGANTFKVFDYPGLIYVVAQVSEGRQLIGRARSHRTARKAPSCDKCRAALACGCHDHANSRKR